MKDLMVDIETLGTRKDSVITQIGACYFDRVTAEIGDTFLINISIDDCLKNGLRVDGGAIKFWLEQPGERVTFLKAPVGLSSGLGKFREFSRDCDTVWSHPFDMRILDDAYRVLGQSMHPNYRKHRDIRTLVDLAKLPYNKPDKPKDHNALNDCLYQVKYCVECFKAISEGRGK